MGRHKTPEEEDAILNNIEVVANDLSEQVGELQKFLKELKQIRHPHVLPLPGIGNGQGETHG